MQEATQRHDTHDWIWDNRGIGQEAMNRTRNGGFLGDEAKDTTMDISARCSGGKIGTMILTCFLLVVDFGRGCGR